MKSRIDGRGKYHDTLQNINPYLKQACDFLKKHSIRFKVKRGIKGKVPPWGEPNKQLNLPVSCGDHFRIVLEKLDNIIVFDFWNSIKAKENDEIPNEYDVLACISGDINCADNFKDFCADYGYNIDSRQDYQTFLRCKAFAKKLNNFFDLIEINELQDIQ